MRGASCAAHQAADGTSKARNLGSPMQKGAWCGRVIDFTLKSPTFSSFDSWQAAQAQLRRRHGNSGEKLCKTCSSVSPRCRCLDGSAGQGRRLDAHSSTWRRVSTRR